MNKKLLAVAVAGALAVPTLAFAQSSVTISGVLKVGVDNLSIANAAASRAGKNTSEMRVTDNSSRIIFNMVEDLGNGLAGIGQVDVRFSTDIAAQGYQANGTATGTGPTTMSAGGNTWVGLRSKTLGTVVVGRQDLHYGLFELNEIAAKAGALMGTGVGLFDFMNNGVAIAGGTRTNNVVMYDSPNWGGFDIRAAWSANPTGVETDLTSVTTNRKGNAWNFNPKYNGGNWGARWSHWEQKSDGGSTPAVLTSLVACTAAQTAAGGTVSALGGTSCASGLSQPADQRADTVLAWMSFGGLKVALGWNKSRLMGTDATNGGNGVVTAQRTAWTVPINYTFGPNNLYFHYTRANNDTATTATDGAKMWALAYVYELSKRTSLGVTYAKIVNDSGGAYNFFTNGGGNSLGQFGSINGGSIAVAGVGGEKPQLISLIARHAF